MMPGRALACRLASPRRALRADQRADGHRGPVPHSACASVQGRPADYAEHRLVRHALRAGDPDPDGPADPGARIAHRRSAEHDLPAAARPPAVAGRQQRGPADWPHREYLYLMAVDLDLGGNGQGDLLDRAVTAQVLEQRPGDHPHVMGTAAWGEVHLERLAVERRGGDKVRQAAS